MYFQNKQDKRLQKNAAALRRNMTDEERHLWFDFLHDYPVRILRQKILAGCIVDFYCAAARLVIEIDGGQHYEAEGKAQDIVRTERINAIGIDVIRFSNADIWQNFSAVKDSIHQEIQKRVR